MTVAAPPSSLDKRCGSCARFVRVIEVTGRDGDVRRAGECLLAIWPAPLYENNTCAKYVARGTYHQHVQAEAKKKPRATGRARAPSIGESDSETAVFEWPPPAWPKDLLDMDAEEFRTVLRSVLREELGAGTAELAGKWRGGEMVLVPGKEGLQERRVSIDSLFHKVVMVRDKLRVLEQKINGHSVLADDEKVQMQQYITAVYGSLTTFNQLFAEREDGFVGQKSDE
jgi:hypothetical protein